MLQSPNTREDDVSHESICARASPPSRTASFAFATTHVPAHIAAACHSHNANPPPASPLKISSLDRKQWHSMDRAQWSLFASQIQANPPMGEDESETVAALERGRLPDPLAQAARPSIRAEKGRGW